MAPRSGMLQTGATNMAATVTSVRPETPREREGAESLFSQMKKGTWGIFKSVMDTLNVPLKTDKFKLPQVVVIGSESVQ
jgi:hypothetical protein